jgi:hypothetical protein
MHASQDIGVVRRELVHRVFVEQRARRTGAFRAPADARQLRDLLDEAHARIRTLEKAVETLAAAL